MKAKQQALNFKISTLKSSKTLFITISENLRNKHGMVAEHRCSQKAGHTLGSMKQVYQCKGHANLFVERVKIKL